MQCDEIVDTLSLKYFSYNTLSSNKNASRTMTQQKRDLEQEPQSEHVSGGESFHPQSLSDHLRDLRSCLIISLVAVAAGFAVAYSVIEPIGVWFFKPLTAVLPQGSSLIFTSYQEGFFFI
jgi:Sec-independent protein secretion pathway component TatC